VTIETNTSEDVTKDIENIDGKSSDEDILHILEKYGISISSYNPPLKNKKK